MGAQVCMRGTDTCQWLRATQLLTSTMQKVRQFMFPLEFPAHHAI